MRGRVLPDDVLIAAELASFVGGLAAVDVSGFLQLHHGGPDGVLALQADPGKTGEGVVPGFRETEHERQQALGLEGEGLVPQVVIAHDGVIVSTLYTKNCHNILLLYNS